MFKNTFSFEGRIRRTEYGISLLIFVIGGTIIQSIGVAMAGGYSSDNSGAIALLFIFYFPLLIFLWAQGAKKCHDIGQSGWMQIIPFYPLIMVFKEGERGINEYGNDPKSREVANPTPPVPPPPQKPQRHEKGGKGYEPGELYK